MSSESSAEAHNYPSCGLPGLGFSVRLGLSNNEGQIHKLVDNDDGEDHGCGDDHPRTPIIKLSGQCSGNTHTESRSIDCNKRY